MSERIRHSSGTSSTGLSGGFGDRQGAGHDPERAARFRRAHRPGDTVRGTFLRRRAQSAAFAGPGAHSGGLGWADIEGQTLLASMPAFPQPGTELLFRVERTEPDIVLRLLAEGDGAAVVPPSPARLAADYANARDRLDVRLSSRMTEALFAGWGAEAATGPAVEHPDAGEQAAPRPPFTAATAAASHAAFAAHVADDKETAALFLACQRARLALLPVLRAAHPGVVLLHLPWLCPTARALDCAILPPPPDATGGGLTRILLGGVIGPACVVGTSDSSAGSASSLAPFLDAPGRFLLHGLLRPATPQAPARLAFRVMAEHPDNLDALLEPLVTGMHAVGALETALLSTGPLPAGPSDPLGLLLATLHGGPGLLT
ncbi:hypothetical protein [Nitratidesulfovibrio liaohensis]|uniref:Uncharacterized protein n=1 Tax=Nitratidesulfovibrio liaohensis TaxID=2604158 RepID=A0ABY9QZD6_9BACT|nr:hypothetical protein [Nitratidesulfovibrio liaohensis]WMW64257.1 hypothetical protein KPS_002259 [Nitratidesulfovibrio liaohensis]